MYQIISNSKLSQPVSRIPVHIWLLICMNSDPMRFLYGPGNLTRRRRIIFFLTKSDRWVYAMTQQTLSNNKTYEKWNLLKVYILFVSLTIHNYMDSCRLSFVFSIFSTVLWSELTCDPPVVNDCSIGSLTCAFTLWVIYCPQGHRVNAGWYPLADDWRYVWKRWQLALHLRAGKEWKRECSWPVSC